MDIYIIKCYLAYIRPILRLRLVILFNYSLWPPCVADADIIFSSCDFFFLLSLFYISSPNLSRRRLDAYHTSTHNVALVRIYDAGLKHTARGSLKK